MNWKVRGPVLLSVAVAVQVMVLPMGSGDFCDGVNETRVTVAEAGAHKPRNRAKIGNRGQSIVRMKIHNSRFQD